MISDTSRILQELEILTNVTLPEADSVKMKYKYEEIVADWIADNQEYVDSLTQ